MPELPDVEAIRLYLISRGLVGRRITGVELLWPRAVRTPPEEKFKSDLSFRAIREIRRRGKYLILGLDGHLGRTLILHLRMTGSLPVVPAGGDRPQHTRNVLLLESGLEVCFVDPRKLGMMWLVRDEAEVLHGLGPEPISPGFTTEVLVERMCSRNAPVKALLCDQAVVAGIGNIYADEVLFLAGVHPLKRAVGISLKDMQRLHQAIITRLPKAIELLVPLVADGGAPTGGEQGLKLLLLPRSKGTPCSRCATPIERVAVRGRSSYFCPHCQTN